MSVPNPYESQGEKIHNLKIEVIERDHTIAWQASVIKRQQEIIKGLNEQFTKLIEQKYEPPQLPNKKS